MLKTPACPSAIKSERQKNNRCDKVRNPNLLGWTNEIDINLFFLMTNSFSCLYREKV
ncbi:uncharacterized protein BDW43DRAFT_282192 [Aspergillus alliaceus]|uniref:uncharacterized protein n=1 Tax=Petromyces alliaceus TaxID=209559 RepID=UPI0012A5E21D|nr:uncharacterized protein BDW43DRAFT_282192 [Aspergillus alliaceus]KAB8231423.1 hypothetical protein BDW43DRAFT_282192 [Aspergillus alliaceus]